jgi:hypothetical protein
MTVIQKLILVDMFSGPVFRHSILSLDNLVAVSNWVSVLVIYISLS